jgi:hypothetical protein
VMATFVRMESDGLVILPTHRVVHGLEGFEWSKFLSAAKAFFEVRELPGALQSSGVEQLRAELEQAGASGPAFVACARPGGAAVLKLRDNAADSSLADARPGLRRLDVFVLHRLLLERVLGIDRDAVREEKNLHYERELDRAVRAVLEGKAQICFLLNPTLIEAVRDNALAGQVMPQKSTDFYPKLLSGLTIFDLEP